MVVYKKKRASKEKGTCDNYTDNVAYAVKTESLGDQREPHSKPISPSYTYYAKPSKPAVNPVQATKLKETGNVAKELYVYDNI